MESPNAAEKPEVSQIKVTETDCAKLEEQQKLESSQPTSEPRNESTIKDENVGPENPSQPENVIQAKEPSDGAKTQDSTELKETGAGGGKQEESEKQTARMESNESEAEEAEKLASDASKAAASIEKTEEQNDEASSEDPKEQKDDLSSECAKKQDEKVNSKALEKANTVPETKPEAKFERELEKNDATEANGTGGQGPQEEKDDATNSNPEEQKYSRSQGSKTTNVNDVMEIDTEPVKAGTGQAAPAGSDETVPTEAKEEEAKEEKEDVAGSAGDVPPKDAMEVDSKLNEQDKTLNEVKTGEQGTKQDSQEQASTVSSADEEVVPSGNQSSAQKPEQKSGESQQTEPKTLKSSATNSEPTIETTNSAGKTEGVTEPQTEDEQMKEEATLPKDTSEKKETTSGRPRRSSARNAYQPRTLRPRTSGRVNNTATVSEPPAVQDSTAQKPRSASGLSKTKQTPVPNPIPEKQDGIDEDNSPRPVMEAKGLVMRVDEAVFVTEDQLDELKIARLTDKKVKPFEHLTFQDLRTYNRDQLRAYCYAYGMARRKKTEMEADMARYLSYWNKGREGFALHEYVPTSSRVIDRVEPNPADSIGAIRAATTTQPASVSREGSVTPTTSNGKASASAKPSSSRGATPSRSGGHPANSARVSGSQGSSALSSASPAGAPTSTGNSQGPGSTQPGIQRAPAVTSRAAKPGNAAPILPRGFATSFKQRVHARQAGAKFKAAYNGAGPAIVNIVENAAAYFEGKDSPEVIVDQAKSYERYQFNVDMLNEIFDGVPDDSDEADGDVNMTDTEGKEDATDAPTSAPGTIGDMGLFKRTVLENLASRVASGKRKAQAAELTDLENQFKEMEEATKYTERTNMRLFQRLERAETKEQIESVKQEFERIHNVKFDESNPPPLVRRKLDKTLPPLVMSDEKCRILRFKVS